MTDLPRGTVAFLMTDIEGSTRLVRTLGPAFPALLGDHFALLGAAVSAHGGTLVSSEGDSIFAVFASAREAVAAAIDGQRALAAHTWQDGAVVRVRMGINAGEAMFGGRDYTGLEVHRTARIMAAGHGGQVLLSGAARALAGESGPDVAFRDLGSHALRDMPEPDQLFQLEAPGLPAEFPALRTAAPTVPTNLPTPMTRFIGRAAELAAAGALLAQARLLTLTGPGGTGKTRLAIELGRAALAAYPGGVWFVGLDAVRDPALVLPAIVGVLAAPEVPGRPLAALVADRIAGSATLLILDNMEQVIGAAADVAVLLGAAPDLTVLATSREPLAIAGEQLFAVPPLGVPDGTDVRSAAALRGSDCVDLFVERARATRADFALSDANAATIAAICRRLDGLPLAVELAAARINVLSADQILARMDHRMALLASTRRDLTDRQRTLRGAIEWSYELLTEPERTFFRRFSAFAGGADLESAQAVIDPASELGVDVLDVAAALVDRSLLRSAAGGGGNRLEILETLREFATDKLAESPAERTATLGRHLAWFCAVAEASEEMLTDPRRNEILDRLDRDLPNLRAAIAEAIARGDTATGARIAAALRDFWHTRGHLVEGDATLTQLARLTEGDAPTVAHARLLSVAAEIASWTGDYAGSHRLAEAARAVAEQTGDRGLVAQAEQSLGWATFMAEPAYARGRFERAIELATDPPIDGVLRGALQGYAITLVRLDDWTGARAAIEDAIAVAERMGDRYINGFNFVTRGVIEARLGDRDAALRDHLRSLDDTDAAGSMVGVALAVEALALDALDAGDPQRAATLAAGAIQLRASVGGGPTVALAGFGEPLAMAEQVLEPGAFETAAAAGRALSTEALVALAREVAPGVTPA